MGKKRRKKSEPARGKMDYSLFFIIIFLICFGLVMIYSTSSFDGFMNHQGDSAHYLKNQARAAILGGAVMMALAFSDYHFLKKLPVLAYVGSMIAIALVKSPLGYSANGATRWISIMGLSIQPAEIAKVAVIVLLAAVINKNRSHIGELRCAIRVAALVLPVVGMILILTKNLSSAIIILGIAVVMLFVSSPKYSHYVFLVGGAGIVGAAVIKFGSGFRMQRIEAWRNPELYADTQAYQTMQSLYAIGSGGLVGKGLGQSVQKLGYVPEAQNDMIFSIICEELGLFGGIAVIIMFVFMIWRFMIIANRAKDLFGSMLVVGIMAHISIQVVLNIAVVTNTIPNTGITLPFISYGGTSIVFLLAEMGIALSVSRYERNDREMDMDRRHLEREEYDNKRNKNVNRKEEHSGAQRRYQRR